MADGSSVNRPPFSYGSLNFYGPHMSGRWSGFYSASGSDATTSSKGGLGREGL